MLIERPNPQRTRPGAAAIGAQLARLREWMAGHGWSPLGFQQRTWDAYLAGSSGLLSVPTGAGKTYGAFLAPLAELMAETEAESERGLSILFITPLRAMSRDIEKALRRPVDELGLGIRVESRTGDTSETDRARQRRAMPDVLLTTPESLCLLLASNDAAIRFANLRCVIIDEWHELLSSKRGSQVELCMSRLRRFSPDLRTWALSATLSNLEEAAQVAVGADQDACLIAEAMPKTIDIRAVTPDLCKEGGRQARLPWAGHMGLQMLPAALEVLDPDVGTLIFVNTRSQAELWHQAILRARPDWEPVLALHHGSVEREERERIEAGMKEGTLRLVVCTSSLDLGVDFAPVEKVLQIGSPKGIARLVQRAGRSGHRPGAHSVIHCVPTFGLQLLEIAAVREAIAQGRLEARHAEPKPLDVLAQHMVTCALGGGYLPEELLAEVRTAASFAGITREEFNWCQDLVQRGGASLKAYPRFHRVVPDARGVCRVPSRQIAATHRMNVGTITASATVSVREVGGKRIGSIEESFIGMLKRGDHFVFGGRVLKFERLRDLTAFVTPARSKTNNTPHWAGTRLPISAALGDGVRTMLARARHHDPAHPELGLASQIVGAQSRLSAVPDPDQLLIELCRTNDGDHLFAYPFEGKLVHQGLGAIVAMRLARTESATFETAVNDYGFELLAPVEAGGFDFASSLERVGASELFTTEALLQDIERGVNLGELSRLQFRDIARIAGLVMQNQPGASEGRRGAKHLHADSGLIFDVLREFDPENPLLVQARREVMARHFQQSRLAACLERLVGSEPIVQHLDRPSPLGFPLIVERSKASVSSQTLAERLEAMKSHWGVE